MPQVTIIILTWNASRFFPACLKTLLAQDYPAFSIVIVDNNSTDDTVALARSLQLSTAFPAVQIIENRANLGFAGGNNVALRQVESPLVV
ncbi:MAG: glycosyltransferase family 2 protein, partial [Caldilinea sp.]